jgi:DNA (cytosine-5)-methyltransferase 1
MADLGYSVGWRVLDAQHFGVPQRRRRVFIVGRCTPNSSVAEILFKSEGLRRDLTQSNQARQGTARTADKSVALGSGKDIANCLPAELYHHGTVVNQDANNGHVVVYEE